MGAKRVACFQEANPMQIVLAIDDDPARYQSLARKLEGHGLVVAVVQNPDAADMLLDAKIVVAVFLDHDMPEWNGQHYAREVLGPRNVPVCISSANHAGARAIAEILREHEVPCSIISVTETAADERWLGWVLDLAYRPKRPPQQVPLFPPSVGVAGFKWAPGMLALPFGGCVSLPVRLSDDEGQWPHDLGLRVPDYKDAATGGCLLTLLGESAYYIEHLGDPNDPSPWGVWWEGERTQFTHPGEACLHLAQKQGRWS